MGAPVRKKCGVDGPTYYPHKCYILYYSIKYTGRLVTSLSKMEKIDFHTVGKYFLKNFFNDIQNMLKNLHYHFQL